MDFSDDASTAPEQFTDTFGFQTGTPTLPIHNAHRDNARLEKWQDMLGRWDFIQRSRRDKLKRRVRKGVPDCLRHKVWFDFAGCEAMRNKLGIGLYSQLTESREESGFEAQIRRDVYRTFPKHIFFRQKSGQHALYRVLRAYSLFDREVGYCQGMGFIAGLFLIYMPEDSVFWMLLTLLQNYGIRSLYIPEMPGVYLSIYISQELGLAFLPKTFRHLQEIKLSASLFATNWFMTLFACVFKCETVLRVWDCLLCEGPKIVYRIFLGLIKLCEKDIKKRSFEEALEVIKEKASTVTPDELLEASFSFRLSRKKIEQLEKEFASYKNPTFLKW